jgi:transposase-like protein
MARQYKSYDEYFKKVIVILYENGKGISELSRKYSVGKSAIDS